MAVIVSDATPLNYLVEIRAADVLPQLYGRVIIPPAVRAELSHAKTPKAVREWLSKSPAWLEVVAPSIIPPASLTELDAGEMEAITLALQSCADLLLIDERDGTAARGLGLTTTGTLGVLDLAATRGLIDLRVMFARLQETTFRGPTKLMAQLLEQEAERKKIL
jgi:predicted nucleic acid-binding protein